MSNIQKHNSENSMILRSMDDIVRMGKVFAESGMFKDANDVAKAIVKIQAGAELGIAPFQAMSGVHIIQGKPEVGAGIIASMLDSHPNYDFEVVEHNDKVCTINFFKNGKLRGTSKFTAEDAKRAGTQNMGKFPANMLYARAMSNGVKWYAPGLFSGPVYVHGEIEGNEPDQHQEARPTMKASKKTEPKPDNKQDEEPQDAVIVEEEPKQEAAPAPPEDPMTKGQRDILIPLLSSPHLTDQEKERIKSKMETFSKAEASKTIEILMKWVKERKQAKSA
jgi:hypothetical protein